MSISRTDVVAAVERCFPGSACATVLAVLDDYGIEPHERERERVKIGHGGVVERRQAEACQLVRFAKTGYRDVLSWHATGPLTPEAGEKALHSVRDVLKRFGQP